MLQLTLLDQSLGDIKNKIEFLIKIYNKKYKKKYKIPVNEVPLKIWFKRGPIVMKNGEWSKMDVSKLTLDRNKIVEFLSRKNLQWGILGYGNPKDGLKELLKWTKNHLNPAQLKGDNQDLKMEISGYKFLEEKKCALIQITVPEKGMEGKDIRNKTLEQEGYIGINKFKELALKKLNNTNTLDKALLDVLSGDVKLSDLMDSKDKNDLKDSEYSLKEEIKKIMEELEESGYLDEKNGLDRVLEGLEDKGIQYNIEEVEKIFDTLWYDMFYQY